MSKVITFSRTFPKGHPREGEPTEFVEKIYNNLGVEYWKKLKYLNIDGLNAKIVLGSRMPDPVWVFHKSLNDEIKQHKHHTIRQGNRFKVGDKFSPRVWSEKAYKSPQIILANDLVVKSIYEFEIKPNDTNYYLNGKALSYTELKVLAQNDGLSLDDFECWFNVKQFKGQVICWSEQINYVEQFNL